MTPEDIALAFISILTIVTQIIPPLANAVSPQDAVIILSIGAILKAILGDLQARKPPQ